MAIIAFDFETKSYADLKKVGSWCYSEDPTTEVICCAYGIGDADIQSWWPGKELADIQAWVNGGSIDRDMPRDLYVALMDGDSLEVHGSHFEYAIWTNICIPKHGWIEVLPHQWRDTMATASYYSMPPGLDRLAKVIGLPGKNPEGGRLITKYSKLHLKTAKDHIPDHEWVEWGDMTATERENNPDAREDGGYYCEDFMKFVEYCADDIRQQQGISSYLGDLPETELLVFRLDQEINIRGLLLNENSIDDAMAIVDVRASELYDEFKEITGFAPTQHARIMEWLEDRDVPMDNLQAEYIEEVLEGEKNFMPEGETLRALQIRVKYNKASTKKLAAMIRHRGRDGRARFQSKYHGASTGRWTAQGFQILNLSKGFEGVPPDQLIKDLRHRDPVWLDIMYGDAMEAVGKASRHHIVADKGNRIIAGDFVSIEAVLLACLAEEEWKVEAFHRGDPIYELMGCSIHNLPPDAVALAKRDKDLFKHKYPAERFDGKTGELAFGYQGALGAWRKFDNSDTHTDERIIEICQAWRAKHPAIVDFWYALERAAIECLNTGRETYVNEISFKMIDDWLSMRLPNGKRIWYFKPELRLTMPQWHKPSEWQDCADGTCYCQERLQLTYMSQKSGQWIRVWTYGGKLAENATQATSREILIPAMFGLREHGYKIIFSVYDEIVTEQSAKFGSVKEVTEIMAEYAKRGGWSADYPIKVDAWEGKVYKK